MKRRILVTILSIVLVMSFMPSVAFAGGEAVNAAEINNWAELKSAISSSSTGAKIVLTADIIGGTSVNPLYIGEGKDLTIDLNGHKICRNLESLTGAGHVFDVLGKLNIDDSSQGKTGMITGGNSTTNAGAIYIANSNAVFTLTNGKICGNISGGAGGAVCIDAGTFVMKGGSIENNQAIHGGGVNIFDPGTFTLLGGKISNNIAMDAGGAVFARGDFYMLGGEISGNRATKHGGGVYANGITHKTEKDKIFKMTGGVIKNNYSGTMGGGVFIDYYSMETQILGGSITGNTASESGGGVYVNDYVVLGGTAYVSGNTVSGSANNVYLPEKRIVKIATVEGAPRDGMRVGISMEKLGTFATGLRNNISKYFFADNEKTLITYDSEGRLQLSEDVWYEAKKVIKETLENMQSVTVKFDMQGHGEAVHDKYVLEGSKINSKPETPKAEGYVFGGWYKDAACTQAWDWDTDVVLADTTLYAKWISTDVEKTSIKSLKLGKNRFTVKLKKIDGAKAYQIKYSVNKNMKNADYKLFGGNSVAVKKTVKQLKAGKTYYVQARTLRTVNGKIYYSAWTKVKKVRTK